MILLLLALLVSIAAALRAAPTAPLTTALRASGDAPRDIERCEFGTGCVLVSQKDEYSHYLIKASVLVYNLDKERGAQGVLLDRPTAFSMGETAPGIGAFEANTLYMGGDEGPDMAVMFHSYELEGAAKPIGNGLYLGGLGAARRMVEGRLAVPRDFKFIFNNIEWGPGVLEQEIAQGKWDVVRVPPALVLNQSPNMGTSLWAKIRRKIGKGEAGEDEQ